MPIKEINSSPLGTPQPLFTPDKIEKQDFYDFPNSPATNLLLEAFIAGENIEDLPDRKATVSNGITMKVLQKENQRQIVSKSHTAKTTLELSDFYKITGSNKTLKKIFVFTLIKANEQAMHNGELTRNRVSFPLHELVETGCYTTIQSARKGFKKAMDALMSIRVKGNYTDKKNRISVDTLQVLFTGASIINGQCLIDLNNNIQWRLFALFFTKLPRYYFELPNRASELLLYIFYLARQHTKEIAERGYFTINFRAIQQRLCLPSEKDNTRPQQTIKEPIENAIEQIETAHSEYYKNRNFALLPVYDEKANISDYLDRGCLKVSLKGEFAKPFMDITNTTNKRIEQSEKKKDQIEVKARAMNLAKHIESQDNNKNESGN